MDIKQIRDIFRIGRVSSVNAANCTARVTFPDKDDTAGKGLVSQELPIIVVGSHGTLGYWVPEVDTQVLCCFLPNPAGTGMNEGFILGAFYSVEDPPEDQDENVRSIRFPDGSFFHFDGKGTIRIHASSHLILTAPRIDLN
ncbi:MAG: phage baseplate assembly protein V [Acidaminococcaceae bacterium]|nr:phage baseplate assembly protein V [Acidaminococcaceae bacterium]